MAEQGESSSGTAKLIAQLSDILAFDPELRGRVLALLKRPRTEAGGSMAALEYFDSTLESPRLRAVLEEAKHDAAARLIDAH